MKKQSNFKKIIKTLQVVGRIEPLYLVVTVFRGLISSIIPFVNIFFSYKILDSLVLKETQEVVMGYVFYLIGLNLILGIFNKVLFYYREKMAVSLSLKIKNKVSLKTYEMDFDQLENQEIMNMIKRAEEGSNGSGGIEHYCIIILEIILSNILQVIYAGVMMAELFVSDKSFVADSFLASFANSTYGPLIIIFMILVVTLVGSYYSKKGNVLGYKAMMENIEGNRKYSYLGRFSTDYHVGKDIRLYRMQPMLISIMSDSNNSVNSIWEDFANKEIGFQIIVNIFTRLLLLLSYVFVGLKALFGLISIGNVVSLVSSITILSVSLNKILSSILQINNMNSYMENYFKFLDLKTSMTYGEKEIEASNLEIEFKNVSFSYPRKEGLILDHVSFTIKNGEKIAIVGENGAGKTTLIKLLCRFYDPTEGEILVNGINIKEFSRKSLYKLFSVVFQDFKLFPYSIASNVAASDKYDKELVEKCLENAGVMDRVRKMDKGIETIIYQVNKEKGVEISGGEAQKIAIARALYKNSPMVILDEPTSALDPISEAEIYASFNEMVTKKTSIFISHRMSSCKFCDCIIVFQKGKIEEIGNHNALIKEKKLYYNMWEAQAKYYQ